MKNSTQPWMIYGANGYTGRLIAEEAVRRGHRPLLAGRSPEKIVPLAQALGLEHRCFGLDSAEAVAGHLKGIKIVVHAAGPFSRTAIPLLNGCLKAKTHYMDITGEIEVFESIYARHQEISAAGICAIPGMGFDVVPTDAIAKKLHEQLPDAQYLELGFVAKGGISHGTLTTMVEKFGDQGATRVGGKLKRSAVGAHSRQQAIGGRTYIFASIPWGDLASAYRSTAIPNIITYTAMPEGLYSHPVVRRVALDLASLKPVQSVLLKLVDTFVHGPSEESRKNGVSLVWGEVRNAAGATRLATLRTLEGYTLSGIAPVQAVEEIFSNDSPVGALTPTQRFGSDFIFRVDPQAKLEITTKT